MKKIDPPPPLRNPLTDRHQNLHGWLLGRYLRGFLSARALLRARNCSLGYFWEVINPSIVIKGLTCVSVMVATYLITRGYANSRIANSRTGRLADWTSRGLDKSRTRQLVDATGDFACLVFVFWPFARPRVVQSATCPVRELAIHELANPRVVQLPLWFVDNYLPGHSEWHCGSVTCNNSYCLQQDTHIVVNYDLANSAQWRLLAGTFTYS